MRKIAHIGDAHWGLGYPGPSPESRFQDIDRIMQKAADTIIAEKCDLVLFAGDAFKDSKVYIDRASVEIRAFAKWLRRFSDAGIPVVAISGTPSHDALPGYDLIREMGIPGVHVVTSPEIVEAGGFSIGCLPGLNRSGLLCREDWQDVSVTEVHAEMSRVLLDMARAFSSQGAQILLSHLSIEGSDRGFDDLLMLHEPILPREVLGLFDITCLGHIHIPQEIPFNVVSLSEQGTQSSCRRGFYCGSPERLSFNDESVDTGFWIHYDDWKTSQFISTDSRNYVTIRLDEGSDIEEVMASTNLKDAIVRVQGELSPQTDISKFKRTMGSRIYDAGAFWLAGIHVSVPAIQERGRAPEVVGTLHPLTALEKWCHAQKIPSTETESLRSIVQEYLEEKNTIREVCC